MDATIVVTNSYETGYTYPVNWVSPGINVTALGGDGGTFHIVWADCAMTFYLIGNYVGTTPFPGYDWTADYRALDPAWVDPVLGDPATYYPVRWKNLGFRYVYIGWTGAAWGVGGYTVILFHRDRYLR